MLRLVELPEPALVVHENRRIAVHDKSPMLCQIELAALRTYCQLESLAENGGDENT